MGTSNPGIMRGMAAARNIIDPNDLDALVQAAVTSALAGALAGKADLVSGVVPDGQLPLRLSDTEIQTLADNAANTAVTTVLTGRNLPAPSHTSSVALGADTTAEAQISGGAKHIELLPSTAPLAPTSGARLWVSQDSGTLKHQLNIIFPTGASITLANEL